MRNILRFGWKAFIVIAILSFMAVILAVPPIVEAIYIEGMPDDPRAPEGASADFVVFGDSQGSLGYLWPVSPHFDDMLGLINQIDVPIAFHVGDMYTGDGILSMNVSSQAERYLGDVSKLGIPVYPVMGNHEAAGNGWEITKEMVFRGENTYYSFDKGDSHFIVLDAFESGTSYRISDEQLAWLIDDLQTTTVPHVFVFMHAPLYPTVSHIDSSMDKYPEERDQLVDILVGNGVDVVFAGHEHCYIALEYQGLVQITSSGAGCELRAPDSYEAMLAETGYDVEEMGRWKAVRTMHYVFVSTTANTIDILAYDFEGNIIDELSLLT